MQMGPETVSVAASEAVGPVETSAEVESNTPVSEVLQLSFNTLHGAPRNPPTHAQMAAPTVMGLTVPALLESLPVVNSPTHKQMVAPAVVGPTEPALLEVPQVVIYPHRRQPLQ